jgi:hypothetical protein
MALLDDVFSGWGGIVVGLGAAVVAPAVLPALGTVVRPVAKGLVRGTLFVSDQAMALVSQVGALAADTRDQVSDLVEEAVAESKSTTRSAARSARG